MNQPPTSVLALLYALHMLSTVLWLGGTGALLWVIPFLHKTQPPEKIAALLEQIQRRFDPLVWLCFIILAATGMFQMSANPNYQGLLAIENRWAMALFIKHLLFAGMGAINAALTFVILPGLQRAALLQSRNLPAPAAETLVARQNLLLRLNLILGVLVLLLTALARVS
ncbi:MAG: hypothetical protein OHK0052_04220 [Anaerolineales bacterium]